MQYAFNTTNFANVTGQTTPLIIIVQITFSKNNTVSNLITITFCY